MDFQKLLSKYWYYVVGGFIVLVILFKFFKKLFKSDVKLDVQTSDIVTPTAPISDDVAYNLATQIMIAIDRIGTDEQAIDEVYKKIGGNLTRLKKVYDAFGMPYYSSAAGVVQQKFFAVVFGAGTARRTLREVLKYELSAKDFEKWNKLFLAAGIG